MLDYSAPQLVPVYPGDVKGPEPPFYKLCVLLCHVIINKHLKAYLGVDLNTLLSTF